MWGGLPRKVCTSYTCAGIGADTERWLLFVKDQALREKRHRAVLRALRDSLVSPDGEDERWSRTPLLSTRKRLCHAIGGMTDETCMMYPFETIDAFYRLMNTLIATSVLELHPYWRKEISR